MKEGADDWSKFISNWNSNASKLGAELCTPLFGKGLEATPESSACWKSGHFLAVSWAGSLLSCPPTHQPKMVSHFHSPFSVVSYKHAQLLSLRTAA